MKLRIQPSRCKAIFVHTEMSGLCNRLRGYCSARTVAEILDVPIAWQDTPDWACPERLDKFYNVPCRSVVPSFARILFGKVLVFDKKSRPNGRGSPERFYELVESEVSWEDFFQRYQSVVQSIELQPTMQSKLDYELRRYDDLGKAIGVHIRRTDVLEHNRRYLSDEQVITFLRTLEKQSEDTRFFLACDNQESRERYLGAFPTMRALDYTFSAGYPTGSTEARRRLAPIESAVLDLHLLAHCRAIVRITNSSFAQMAATMGNCPLLDLRITDDDPDSVRSPLIVPRYTGDVGASTWRS